MLEKCRNNNKHNSENPLTSRRTDTEVKTSYQGISRRIQKLVLILSLFSFCMYLTDQQ